MTKKKPQGRREAKPEKVSLRAYAKRRGQSHEAVRRAIETGRLSASVAHDAHGRPYITDAELADREWAERTLPRREPVVGMPTTKDEASSSDEGDAAMTIAEATRRLQIERWKRERAARVAAEIDVAERRGELVEREEVEARFVDAVTAAKTKLLGVPSRIRQGMPQIQPADVQTIESLIREALEELAG